MKKIMKTFMALSMVGSLSFFTDGQVSANEDIASTCNYTAQQGVNPNVRTMNCLLTETALSYHVPPEIVKAIAEGESSNWRHFDHNGDAIVTSDGGIGVMQLTNQANYDQERLKSDIVYNIQAGVEVLNRMFERSDLPTINGGQRDVLEHWYFAIMAYNGTKPVNSPIVQATGERNPDAYQEKIIRIMENLGLVQLQELPFTRDDFRYDSSSTANIEFVTKNYQFDVPHTKTRHSFQTGHKAATTTAVQLRERPTRDSHSKGTIAAGEIVTIEGPFKYEEVLDRKNHFVWYPVKRSNGTTGYVASSYLTSSNLTSAFKDVPSGHYAEESIDYLANRGILAGVGNGNFGLGQPLTRWQAVLLLLRANQVSLDDRPNPGFTDVPVGHPYYNEIAAAVDAGLFGGVSDTTFAPNAHLTRREMAVVLQRIYDFPEATGTHPFTDVPSGLWFSDAIHRVYSVGVTNGVTNTTFGPLNTVTREQFAVFLTRSIDDHYRLERP